MVKPFDKLLEPDERFRAFVRFSDLQPVTFKDHYDSLGDAELRAAVPVNVRTAFDRARAAYAYAWFSYELTTLAQSQACAALELALRELLEARYPGKRFRHLNTCLEKIIADGDLADLRLKSGHRTYSKEDLAALKDLLVHVRNDVAHGSEMLMTPEHTLHILEPCARIIDRIYGVRV